MMWLINAYQFLPSYTGEYVLFSVTEYDRQAVHRVYRWQSRGKWALRLFFRSPEKKNSWATCVCYTLSICVSVHAAGKCIPWTKCTLYWALGTHHPLMERSLLLKQGFLSRWVLESHGLCRNWVQNCKFERAHGLDSARSSCQQVESLKN